MDPKVRRGRRGRKDLSDLPVAWGRKAIPEWTAPTASYGSMATVQRAP
jgi:hypothetical protein